MVETTTKQILLTIIEKVPIKLLKDVFECVDLEAYWITSSSSGIIYTRDLILAVFSLVPAPFLFPLWQ